MQNFKKIMSKNFCSAFIFFTYLFVMPSIWMAEGADVPPQVFVGNMPTAIIVQRGEPVEVPIFFVGGTYIDREVELYVFTVDEEGNVVCFGPNGWESDYAVGFENYKPFCNVPGLPEHIYVPWRAFEDSQSLSNFDLWVCVDDQIDEVLTESSSHCGCQSIIIEEVNGDTGDGGNDTGDGGTQPLTPPSFPGLGDDSGGSCNSLNFTPEGTTSSSSSISKSLELGESEQITLLTSACGKSVTVSSVTKTCGGEWLSVSEGSKIILNLNTTGLQAGSTERCTVTVAAGGITDNMYVTLRVVGQCDATSASVSPSSLSFHAYVGGQNPNPQTLRVRDNCGHAVSATVVSKPYWVTLSNTSTGVFSVSCSEQSKGTHSGTIILTDSYDQRSVSVTLEVADTSSDGSVTTVTSGHTDYYDIKAGHTRFFKFVAGVSDPAYPIQVSNTPQPKQPRTVYMLIKRGSKPTIGDFTRTYQMSQSQSGTGDLYWQYSTGTEFVEIDEPMVSNTFYIMLYNNGTSDVGDQRLKVNYYD